MKSDVGTNESRLAQRVRFAALATLYASAHSVDRREAYEATASIYAECSPFPSRKAFENFCTRSVTAIQQEMQLIRQEEVANAITDDVTAIFNEHADGIESDTTELFQAIGTAAHTPRAADPWGPMEPFKRWHPLPSTRRKATTTRGGTETGRSTEKRVRKEAYEEDQRFVRECVAAYGKQRAGEMLRCMQWDEKKIAQHLRYTDRKPKSGRVGNEVRQSERQ